jgi:branched-chain amino acid transport system substrate-binding protein
MKRWVVAATCLWMLTVTVGAAADTPGVTATEVKIGNTMPYSGPVSSYSPIGKLDVAFSA